MSSTRTRIAASLAAAAGIAALAAAPAQAAQPDVQCQRAGLSALQDAGLMSTAASKGVDLTFAVEKLGVGVRPGADISGVPNPVPLSVLLADHRAGDNSLFLYPWCG